MIRWRYIGIVAVCMALIGTSLFASNGTQIGTVGAKPTAMGSAFRGLSDDWTAVFYNPAGLTQIEKGTIGISNGMISPRGNYTAYPYPTSPFTGMYTDSRELTPKDFFVPALGIFKTTGKWTTGLGVYAPFGLGTEWDLYSVPDGYGNPNAISKKKESYSDHQVIAVQPTAAYQLTEKISVGLGLSYIWGKMTIDQIALPVNPLVGILADPNYALLATVLGPLSPDQSRLIVENNLEGDGYAYGANIGMKWDISKMLSVGISGRFFTDLKLKGKMIQTLALPGDPVKLATVNAIPEGVLDPAQKQQLLALFSGQNTQQVYDGEVEADLPLPWTVGVGIAVKPISNLTITADASLTNWAAWDSIEVKLSSGGIQTMKEEWENTLELGLGVEWKALQMGNKSLFLRAGGYTVPTPVPDNTLNPTILDPNNRTVLTGGIGIRIGKVQLDIAYEKVMFGDKDLPASSYVFDPNTYVAENYPGKYEFNASVITGALTIDL